MSTFSFKRAFTIATKETRHIRRDLFTLALALILPVLIVCIFGPSIDFDAKSISIAIFDADKSEMSRSLSTIFSSSGYFENKYVTSLPEGLELLKSEKVRSVLIIDHGFEQKVKSHKATNVQLLIDGAESGTVGSIIGYVEQIQKQFLNVNIHVSSENIKGDNSAPAIVTRFMYNSGLRSTWFIVPGLGALVLGILAVMLTSLTIAREWESGSMEQLLSTPVTPLEIILGKIIPYIALNLAATVIMYLAARLVFGLPFRGSYLAFFLSSFLFITSLLAIGVLISTTARQQQVAMQASMEIAMVPSMVLSGFIYPIESMPWFFRTLTYIIPARWYTTISRSMFLRTDAGLWDMRMGFLMMSVITILLIVAATKKLKRTLDI